MLLPLFSRVRLLSNDYLEDGLKAGDEGVIVEIYGEEAYEIDFSNVYRSRPSSLAIRQGDVELVSIEE